MFSISSGVLPAQAEDAAPALAPPTAVSDDPAALETLAPQDERGIKRELSPSQSEAEGDANVEIYSSTREDGTKIDEYSRHGHVYMVKVSPPGGFPPYYLYDNDGNGTFERRLPGGYKHISPPEWVIQRF